MGKLSILALLGLLVSLMAIGESVVQAASPQPACGATITSNVKLTGDLDCSTLTGSAATPVAALTVGADNITINLGGFSIIGPASLGAIGVGACPAFFSSTTNRTIGILVDGFDNTNILNGGVDDFEVGIMVKTAAGVKIKKIHASNNLFNALSVGDFDGILPSAKGGVPDLAVNRVYFHDNRNDHIGVSADSSLSLLNSRIVDGCASGIFAAPLSFGGFPGGTPQANVDISRSSFVDNFRSAVNYWGATGSVESSLIEGNNADTTNSSSSDFGQISLTDLEGGHISIRCNDIRDSLDANGNAIERGIGFRGAIAATTVEVTKNLFLNNPVANHFSTDGALVTIDIHKNTYDTNGFDFDLPGSNWTVDADKNFYVSGAPSIQNAGGNTLTTAPLLKSAQHCRGAVGAY